MDIIEFFVPGFASIPYDIAKWGGGLLWKELRKGKRLSAAGEELYDLVEKEVKQKTGNRLSVDEMAPVCEIIFNAYRLNNKFSLDDIREALNGIGKRCPREEAVIWKQDLDEEVSRNIFLRAYSQKVDSEIIRNTLNDLNKKIDQILEEIEKSAFQTKISAEKLLETLKRAMDRQFTLADNYTMEIKPVDSMLLTDIEEKESGREYIANENKTALLEKLKETERELEPDKPVIPLLMTGEGGIGKTVTMLETAEQLFEEGKPTIYIPLRRLKEKMSLEEFIDAEILRGEETTFDGVWRFCRDKINNASLYLFLDGFNEVRHELKDELIEEIRHWAAYGNIIIVVSSRRTFEEEGCQDNHYQRLCMKRLSWEKVIQYLQKRKTKIPEPEKMSEILGIPLMLKIYTVVERNEKNIEALSRGCSRWRKDLTSPGNLLWDYVQCQIYIANNRLQTEGISSMGLITAAEYIAPYLAAKMNESGAYIIDYLTADEWIEKGLNMLADTPSFQQRKKMVSLKYQEPLFSETIIISGNILDYLTHRLNILRLDENEDGNITLSFEHQDFQDVLHYIYIEDSFKFYQETFFEGAFCNAQLHYDLVTRMSEMMDDKKIQNLWEDFRHDRSRWGEYGISNIVEIIKRKFRNDLSGVDFTGADLKNTKLSGVILAQKERKAIFRKAKISVGTFSSEGHSATVDSVSFNNTGAKFVSASYDRLLRIWNTCDGKRLADLEGHTHYVRCAAWSPDGKTIISGGDDTKLIVWDAYAKLELKEDRKQILEQHKGWIYCADWSSDGTQFASGDSSGVICIWNYEYDHPVALHKAIQAHKRNVKSIVWSPTTKGVLASGSAVGEMKIWKDGVELVCLDQFPAGVQALSWSPDGKMLVAGVGNMLYIWEICLESEKEKVKLTERIETPGHTITRVVWTSDFIAFALDKNLNVLSLNNIYSGDYTWHTQNGYSFDTVSGHKSVIQCLAWSEKEQKLITGADDSSIRIWKARNPLWHKEWNCICAIEGASLPVRCVTWSEDSKSIVAGYDDNVLRKWNLNDAKCCKVLKGHENRVKCVDWSENYIVSGSNDAVVRVWDAETGECIAHMDQHKSAVNCVQWFSDHQRIVSGSDDNTLILWKYTTDEKICLKGHDDRVYCVSLSPDERIIASGSNDRTIRFWDSETGKELKDMRIMPGNGIGHKAQIRAIDWSCLEDFPVLASGSNDKKIICWKQDSNKKWKQEKVLTGHDDFVYCLSWKPNSVYIVSGSTDCTLWIWNAETGEKIHHMTAHTNYAHGVDWSPSGDFIASASCDGSIIIWDVRQLPKVTSIRRLVAINAVDLIGCDFTEAEFETEELKKLIQMSGGEI